MDMQQEALGPDQQPLGSLERPRRGSDRGSVPLAGSEPSGPDGSTGDGAAAPAAATQLSAGTVAALARHDGSRPASSTNQQPGQLGTAAASLGSGGTAAERSGNGLAGADVGGVDETEDATPFKEEQPGQDCGEDAAGGSKPPSPRPRSPGPSAHHAHPHPDAPLPGARALTPDASPTALPHAEPLQGEQDGGYDSPPGRSPTPPSEFDLDGMLGLGMGMGMGFDPDTLGFLDAMETFVASTDTEDEREDGMTSSAATVAGTASGSRQEGADGRGAAGERGSRASSSDGGAGGAGDVGGVGSPAPAGRAGAARRGGKGGAAAGAQGADADAYEQRAVGVLGCLEVPQGGPAAVMAEALADMHEVFTELPQQLHELQEERREAQQGTSRKRKQLVARLLGLRVFRRALGPSGLLLRDKLSFLLGTSMMWVCAFWLGRSPASFHLLYGGMGAVLMACRWALYFHRKWHYYLYDFCYYANLLLVLQLTLLPRWAPLAKVTFAYNTGPLAWSILTFRNSLVFHDLDKVTSLFLHLVPALVSCTLRWHQPPDGRFGPHPGASQQDRSAWGAAGPVSSVLLPLAFYVAWALAYYLKIFVFSRAKIQQRGYRTLFNYVTSQKKGTFHAIARRIPPPLQPPAYLALHLCFCAATFVVALGCWYSYALHTGLLLAVASASIWHGGNYYFEVFARKYNEQLMAASAQHKMPERPPHASPKKER